MRTGIKAALLGLVLLSSTPALAQECPANEQKAYVKKMLAESNLAPLKLEGQRLTIFKAEMIALYGPPPHFDMNSIDEAWAVEFGPAAPFAKVGLFRGDCLVDVAVLEVPVWRDILVKIQKHTAA